jgi:hypothetical protein
LNLGFFLSKNEGSSSWVNLKYERLDIYCTDYGKIGHNQTSCLALQEDKFLSRYLISLKVNVFSNLFTSIPSSNLPENPATSSSTPRKNLIQPLMESSQPHVNQTNILTSFQNSLTPQNTDLWTQNPTAAAKPHAQDTPSHISIFADRLDTQIENTLNAFSLFQKLTQLFSSNLSPPPPPSSLTNQNTP